MAVIAKRKASHQVADALCGMLRSGSYRVGDRMPSELELGAELGVSRSTVREAVRELTSLGVLEIQHGRGTFVRSLRPDLLLRGDSLLEHPNDRIREELLEVRGIVEPEAACAGRHARHGRGDRAASLRRRAPRGGYRPRYGRCRKTSASISTSSAPPITPRSGG